MTTPLIHLAHSPDPDDAFMFWALAKDKFDYSPYRFEHILSDIQTLNEKAQQGIYEVSAISFYAYPFVANRYALLSSGSSMGDNYGPMVVCPAKNKQKALKDLKIAIPGKQTSAYLALQLFDPEIQAKQTTVVPFDQITQQVAEGKFDAGLIIHEGQLTFQNEGLELYVDLGSWWYDKYQLPLPLGGNVVRRDLGPQVMSDLSKILKKSIQLSLENRAEAVEYALAFGRGLNLDLADRFIGMYVNQLTVDYGERGREALKLLMAQASKAGLIPPTEIQFID